MKPTMLSLSHYSACVGDKKLLFDVSLQFQKGSVTVIMGPNGSGKSTLAHVIMGDPTYGLKRNDQRSKIHYEGKDITSLPTEERARLGLFLSFQSPVPIPGVSVIELLRTAYEEQNAKGKSSIQACTTMIRTYAKALYISEELLRRGIHDGFSGGERKKIELLQTLVLQPKLVVFDEIDTGLDVDALRIIGKGIQTLQQQGTTVIIITHNHKILSYIVPDTVIVMDKGRVVKIGDAPLAKTIDEQGFQSVLRM